MTDDEKLALLEMFEEIAWEGLQRIADASEGNPVSSITYYDLETIERCQRVRANLREEMSPELFAKLRSYEFDH